MAEAQEDKATAEADLDKTVKSLANSDEELKTTQTTCMTVAADHEATVAARKEELKVIAEAKKILAETSSGAVARGPGEVRGRVRRPRAGAHAPLGGPGAAGLSPRSRGEVRRGRRRRSLCEGQGLDPGHG